MQKLLTKNSALVIAGITLVFIAILYFMGRIPMCECGFHVWTNNSFAPDTSQNFGDPYSFSHILHGIVFFWALLIVAKKITLEWRFVIAAFIEVAWEILENTPLIINRYRAETASLDYFGDSILNSFGDLIFALFGFWLAYRFGWKISILIFFSIELIMLYFIRDNLTLNVIMLLFPLDVIKEWQMSS